ncbi:MAG: twin-arginine translocase subunit TatC [Thermoproteota archaeon]|jgi:Sec-independent protein secretion pathway component TatC
MESSYFWEELGKLLKVLRKIIVLLIILFAIFLIIPSPEVFNSGNQNIFFYDLFIFWLLRQAEQSYLPPGTQLFAPTITAPLFAILYLAFLLSLAVTIPYASFEIYRYIAPALYKRERIVVKKYIIPFSFLYISGFFFTIFVILPLTFKMLLYWYPVLGIAPLVSISSFIYIIVILPLLGGLLFCIPIFLLPLIEIGVLKTKTLTKNRLLIYLVIAFIAGLISPDPTMLSVIPVLIPIYALYETTVILGKRIERKRLIFNRE